MNSLYFLQLNTLLLNVLYQVVMLLISVPVTLTFENYIKKNFCSTYYVIKHQLLRNHNKGKLVHNALTGLSNEVRAAVTIVEVFNVSPFYIRLCNYLPYHVPNFSVTSHLDFLRFYNKHFRKHKR